MAGRYGGYGNWVKIKHAGGYATGYGHMSRYAKGIRPGVHVSQGQVIGYVGSTGASTGPHLHYEIFFKGARINPVGAKVPTGSILSGADVARFKASKARLDGLLASQGHDTAGATKKLARADFTDAKSAGLRKAQGQN